MHTYHVIYNIIIYNIIIIIYYIINIYTIVTLLVYTENMSCSPIKTHDWKILMLF